MRAEAAEARAEDAVRQKEEAFRQRDEAVRQKNEENARILTNALKALIAQGMPEQQARKTLGLDLPGGNPSAPTNP